MNRIAKKYQQGFRAKLFYWLWLPGLVLGSGQIIDVVANLPRWHFGPLVLAPALVTLVGGLGLIYWSEADLQRRGHGTASPAKPARLLVTTGSYGLCRHPMFLGYDLAAGAIVFMTGSPATIVVSFPIFLVWQVRFLRREEAILVSRFAEDYGRYRQRVPFLFPLLPPRQR